MKRPVWGRGVVGVGDFLVLFLILGNGAWGAVSIQAVRCPANPLITAASSPSIGENINGPSVIRVPGWIKRPLGKYYMYFAGHNGDYIRLAYANDPAGPWKIFEPGTLQGSGLRVFNKFIASPDVHVDEKKKEIWMYFSGPLKHEHDQWTSVATSKDGIHFKSTEQILGKFYFRVFRWKDYWYAFSKDGNTGWGELSRSRDAMGTFQVRGPFIARMRHSAVLIRGSQLIIFYSRKGDAPEKILVSTMDLEKDWKDWEISNPVEVLAPEAAYEGVRYPVMPSQYGPAINVRQLRDPCVFEDDGRIYLYYSVAGETGIAMAEVTIR